MAGLEGLLLGRVLGGRYRIEEVIGRGGMGAVYRAIDERLGRRVAVKVITVAMGDDPETRRRVRARFHREARAAAALPHHPNVVPVYDYGTDDELGLDFIVMELLQGHDLATRLGRAGAPPLATALRILREAARGLAVGHRAGLIHRDVKPGNIFLAQDHDELQVRMVDFGIAKLADDEDTANQLTQDGRIPHSPAYASPEQLRGLSVLTPASDVFSLGAVGYQLLTAERPFSETDRNRMGLGMPVPVPSLRSRNPAVPAAVEQVIQKALAFDPADRYPDAGVMAAELDRALREMPNAPLDPYPPLAVPPLPDDAAVLPGAEDDDRTQLMDVLPDDEDERTQLMDLEPPPPAAAPVAPPTRERPAEPPRSRPPTAVAPRKRRTAVWVWSFVLLALAGVAAWAVMDMGGPPSLADRLPQAADTLATDTATPAPDTAARPPETAFSVNERGLAAYNRGDYQEALQLFRRAVALDGSDARYVQNVGISLLQLGRMDEAATALRQAVDRSPSLPDAWAALGSIEMERGNTRAAIDALQRSNALKPSAAIQQTLQQLRAEELLLGEPVDTPAPPPVRPSATPEPATPDTAA